MFSPANRAENKANTWQDVGTAALSRGNGRWRQQPETLGLRDGVAVPSFMARAGDAQRATGPRAAGGRSADLTHLSTSVLTWEAFVSMPTGPSSSILGDNIIRSK